MTDKIATVLHVLLTKFHTIHTTNYPDFSLDLCPYSFATAVCLALDYSLLNDSRVVTSVLLCLTKNAVLSLLVVSSC